MSEPKVCIYVVFSCSSLEHVRSNVLQSLPTSRIQCHGAESFFFAFPRIEACRMHWDWYLWARKSWPQNIWIPTPGWWFQMCEILNKPDFCWYKEKLRLLYSKTVIIRPKHSKPPTKWNNLQLCFPSASRQMCAVAVAAAFNKNWCFLFFFYLFAS